MKGSNAMKTSELIDHYRNEILKIAVETYKQYPTYNVDIYLYPDGRVRTFDNIGGNSWLDDEHILVMTINLLGYDEDAEEYDIDIEEAMNLAIDDRINIYKRDDD